MHIDNENVLTQGAVFGTAGASIAFGRMSTKAASGNTSASLGDFNDSPDDFTVNVSILPLIERFCADAIFSKGSIKRIPHQCEGDLPRVSSQGMKCCNFYARIYGCCTAKSR